MIIEGSMQESFSYSEFEAMCRVKNIQLDPFMNDVISTAISRVISMRSDILTEGSRPPIINDSIQNMLISIKKKIIKARNAQ